MPFRFLRLLDQILGSCLLLILQPLCSLAARWMPVTPKQTPQTITVLKLHGGGSLLIALPALLGIRNRYPQATLTLVGTPDTQKYAEMTGLFDHYIIIDSTSLTNLATSGFKALAACQRQDVLIDLEPHSTLAAVFAPLTFAARRIGFVKAHRMQRAASYTDALYFNLHAPIHIFYEQAAKLLGASLASHETCRQAVRAKTQGVAPLVDADQPKPVIYVSPFASSLSKERMLPPELWLERLREKSRSQPLTLIIGGGPSEADAARAFAARIQAAMPHANLVNACGKRSLPQSAADIDTADEFWGIDSGPLHIARLLGKKCTSFWGPTNPDYLLAPIPDLEEQLHYRSFPCSPCVHVAATAPCKGNNQCMKQLFADQTVPPMIKL